MKKISFSIAEFVPSIFLRKFLISFSKISFSKNILIFIKTDHQIILNNRAKCKQNQLKIPTDKSMFLHRESAVKRTKSENFHFLHSAAPNKP